MEENYIAALDVGTTTVRCHIYNSSAEIVGSSVTKVELVYPQPGYVEVDPDVLWGKVVAVITQALKDARLSPSQLRGLGISTLRSTFITWERSTGRHFHNIITWKDLRATALVDRYNSSWAFTMTRIVSRMLYTVTRNNRYLAGAVGRFMPAQSSVRLAWVLQNNPEVKAALEHNNLMFGTVDTWLIYKLTAGKVHATDITNASATGIFDPFIRDWSGLVTTICGIPERILPKVVENTADIFGTVDKDIFGADIPLLCSLADQSASIYGSCCFNPGDLKVTLGTGGFLDVTTGSWAHASMKGLYPLVGWQNGEDISYVAEGASNDTGSLIEWAIRMNIISDPRHSSDLAKSVPNNDGVFFIPAFSGLGAPVNNDTAAAGFLGIKPTTTKAHMMRAILESIVFRIVQLYTVVMHETRHEFTTIRVDGGVAQNDFVCQLLADMTSLKVERPKSVEMSTLGVLYLAGLKCGMWNNKEELTKLRQIDRVFEPSKTTDRNLFENWNKALQRFTNWY